MALIDNLRVSCEQDWHNLKRIVHMHEPFDDCSLDSFLVRFTEYSDMLTTATKTAFNPTEESKQNFCSQLLDAGYLQKGALGYVISEKGKYFNHIYSKYVEEKKKQKRRINQLYLDHAKKLDW